MLLEKTLRLAQRHVRHNNKPHLHGFFLGSVCVDSGETSPASHPQLETEIVSNICLNHSVSLKDTESEIIVSHQNKEEFVLREKLFLICLETHSRPQFVFISNTEEGKCEHLSHTNNLCCIQLGRTVKVI